jgi:hypothetical protein
MRTGRRIRRFAPLLLLFLAFGGVAGWQLETAFGPATPPASGATGACDPTLSKLVSNHLSVPAGGTAATLTVTCTNLAGRIAGRTIHLRQTGYSTITPTSVITDAQGVAQFEVTNPAVAGPITYTAVDKGSGTAIDQVVQVRFSPHTTAPLPIQTIGLLSLAAMAALVLAFMQVWRRRRSLAKVRVRHVT